MNKSIIYILAFLVITGLVFKYFTYTVSEYEIVVEREFKKIKGKPITTPGLKFKMPWIEARKFDKRWLAWDGDPNQITTLDKRYIFIDVFARWRIADPIVFIEKLGDEFSAQGRLDDILDSATRNVIANHKLIESIRSTNRVFAESDEEKQNAAMMDTSDEIAAELPAETPQQEGDASEDAKAELVVADDASGDAEAEDDKPADAEPDNSVEEEEASPVADILKKQTLKQAEMTIELGRQELTKLILEKASSKAMELGIELKDVRLKRIDYIPSVQNSVFERMVSERQKVAARLRSQGDGLSAQILGRKEKELKKIRSNAYRTAEEIKGDADAKAANIYANSYKKDPELYKFLKTLESYRTIIDNKTWLMITTDSDWASFLKSQK